MSDTQTDNQSGGINATDSSLNIAGDAVGRDKIIQNIIVVGQFLDYAKVQDMLPSPAKLPDFDTISAAFQNIIVDRMGADLVEATSAATEMLETVLAVGRPEKKGGLLSYERVWQSLPHTLGDSFSARNYWEHFSERADVKFPTVVRKNCGIIWLYSIERWWHHQFGEEFLCGIAHFYPMSFLVTRDKDEIVEFAPPRIEREEFRVLMVGLILDLIRLASAANQDMKFWNNLIDSLSPKPNP